MIVSLVAAQMAAGVCWLAAGVYFSPAIWLVLRGRAVARDLFSAIVSLVGFTQAGFIVRWLVWPQALGMMATTELSWWLALYVASAGEALVLVVASILFRRWR